MIRVLIIILGFGFLACSSNDENQETIVVEGKVKFSNNGFIYLQLLTPDGYETIDSTQLDEENSFRLKAPKGNSEIYRIDFFGVQKNSFVLAEEDIYLEAEGNNSMGRFYGKGSPQLGAVSKINELRYNHNLIKNLLTQKLRTARNKNDATALDSLTMEYKIAESEFINGLKQVINLQDGDLTALLLLHENFEIESNLDFYKTQIAIMEPVLANHWYFQMVSNQYADVAKLAVGAIAPEFSLADPGGSLVSLSSFRGSYLFLDFWASWCQPCRMENPDFVKVYNKYKTQNFEILGVSFDKKKDKWIQAIERDGLEWTHVSDLKYFDSKMIDLYNIVSVPTTFLLDPKGKIIAKNIHATELDKILEEVL